jgi:4-amino-4-deoxy-L-arabinose transferase-like glycosyltransferase
MIARLRSHSLLVLLLATRLALGGVYSLVIPPWEGVDEDAHFAYAQYLAAHFHLLRSGDPEAAQIRENHQPPLYYLLVAALLVPLRASQPYPVVTRNPYLPAGAGYNYAVPPLELDAPSAATRSALYAARWLTVLLSTASALAIYAAARRVWPTETLPALAATALYAFWPQQLYLSSVVNNDALVTACAAVFCYSALRVAVDGASPGRLLLLFGSLAAAALTKLNGLALALPAAVALAWGLARVWSQRRAPLWLALGAVGLVLVGTLTGLSSLAYVRAQVFQMQTFSDFLKNAAQDRHMGLGIVLPGLAHAMGSFLAEFGWGNLFLPSWLYWAWGVALGLAILGLTDSFFDRQGRLPARVFSVALAQVLAAVALTLALAVAASNSYIVLGRYFLPALPALALLWTAGWRAVWPSRWRPTAAKTLGVAIVLTGWCAPWLTLAPAYAQPQTQPPNFVVQHPLGIIFDESVELAGYQAIARTAAPGEISLTLCWRAVQPVAQNYTIRLEALAADGQALGALLTYPGHGNYATTHWALNQLFCEPYLVTGHSVFGLVYPAVLRLSLLGGPGLQPVPARDSAGVALARSIDIPVPAHTPGLGQ